MVGTHGALEFADSREYDKLKYYPNMLTVNGKDMTINKSDPIVLPFESKEPLAEECKDFLQCILSRSTPKSSGEDGLKVIDILTRAIS